MTCREAANLLPLLLDGELDAHQTRAVALHGTRCSSCEGELRRLERLHEIVGDAVQARVETVDFGGFWPAVERQLGTVQIPWTERVRVWWSERQPARWLPLPALAAAVALAAVAFLFWTRVQPASVQPDATRVAAVDNTASIDSLDTDVNSVTMLNDPQTRTTVLWVDDEGTPGGAP